MRIGILCHASCGGSTQVAVGLANELSRRGHGVHLFAQAVPFGGRRCATGVEVHTPSPQATGAMSPCDLHVDWSERERSLFLDRLLEVAISERLDVVHFHYALPFVFLALELRERLGPQAPALVGTLHGTDVSVHGRDPRRRPPLEAALKRLDAVTTVSRSHAALAQEVYRLPAPPRVILNGVDTAAFRPRPAGMDRQKRRRPRLVHVSNFRPVKRPVDVARIFIGLRRSMDGELWLVGDGEQMRDTLDLLRAASLANDVRRFGLRDDVGRLVRHADLKVVTSDAESFCLAALEAMACGVPVLAPRVGGIPEVVEDGKTGFLYTPGKIADAVALAGAFLAHPLRYRAMSAAAVHRAAQFSGAEAAAAYERLYLQALCGAEDCRSASEPRHAGLRCGAA
jgi:L-malate glycosyltransferase